ncbi:helix-turn-helix domain-containing protein [Chryseobacterium sp.]|uniref:helix-turn-helix domain-containing protein n=1 Tax=Chryseobacterium sp. TaxID=1871047 RepID=UPI0011CA5AD3|nr:helix-turn-helix transcriptional regulator [Chryseobacterium sp.]TXF78860.1 helix-turn-helix transcriptional regulator [Chryseobacterium sp.]
MNDLSYNSGTSDNLILREIGNFIKSKRIDKNMTQDEVAKRAAVSRSTLSLAERGESIAITNLLKILRTLDALYVLEHFKPVQNISPILLAKSAESIRRRASRKDNQSDKNDLGW